MGRNYYAIKTLTLITVGSYFAYALYWLVKTIPWIVEITLRPEIYSPATGLRFTDSYSVSVGYLIEYSGFLGLIIRVVGASCALVSAFLIFRTKNESFSAVRNKVSKALFFEGLHYLSYVPAIYLLLGFSALPSVSNFLLSTVFFIQILLISPFLIKLALVVKKYESGVDRPKLIRWASLTYMNFVIALWVTYMLKWKEMMAVDPYLFSALSVRILGFLNTIIVQSLAVVFAVVGVLFILKNRGLNKATRLLGLSSIFLSLHIVIYVIYVTGVGITRFIIFGELWVIPLMALGVYLLLKNPKIKL